MGLFTGLLSLPLAAAHGVVRVAGQLYQRAWRGLPDPARVRAELDHVAGCPAVDAPDTPVAEPR